jgi:outer membrane receptor protein involved in Fe transport
MGFNIAYQYKTYRLNANFHRVSHRYTTADHSEFLPAYQLIDLRVQKRVEFKTSNILAGLYIDNILNQSYESIPFQAMPARVFGGSITYQFIKQKTKK